MTESIRAVSGALRVYFLGSLPYERFLALQRRLVYEVGGDDELASLIVCEHPASITIGREGSRQDLRLTPRDIERREWPVRYVARGGGTLLHLPGQVGLYPILPIACLSRTPGRYLQELLAIAESVLRLYAIDAVIDSVQPGLRVRGRRIVHAGIAVRSGVSSFGLVVNVCPDLELFERVDCDGDPRPMTSLERESPLRVRIPKIRVELANAVAERFGYSRQSVFHSHNSLHANPHRR